ASETGPAIHLGGTRSAFPCLAIPAHGEIGSLVGLNRVQRIEHNHAGNERDAIIGELAAFAVASENPQGCFRHFDPPASYLSSVKICLKSSGISGTGLSNSSIVSPFRTMTLFFRPHASSSFG